MTATVTLRSTIQSPIELKKLILQLATEDGIDCLGELLIDDDIDDDAVRLDLADDVLNDALSWLDDVALAEGLELRQDSATLRFGDEDVDFTIKTRGDDDARLGASRRGIEPTLHAMDDDLDFVIITRFDVANPADESTFIQARSFSELAGWTLEYGDNGREYKTIVADVDAAITTILRWMNGENIQDLDWVQS